MLEEREKERRGKSERDGAKVGLLGLGKEEDPNIHHFEVSFALFCRVGSC